MDNNELVIVRVHTIGIDAITTEVVHIEQDFHVQVLGCLHKFFHLGQLRSDKRAIHFALDTLPTKRETNHTQSLPLEILQVFFGGIAIVRAVNTGIYITKLGSRHIHTEVFGMFGSAAVTAAVSSGTIFIAAGSH